MPSVNKMTYSLKNKNSCQQLIFNINRNEVLNKFCKIDSSFVSVNIYTINNNQIILKENQKNDNVEKIQYLLDIYNNINKTL